MQDIDVTVHSDAPAEAVYALLTDGATWPRWSPIGAFALERTGDTAPEGVGAIRAFRTGRITSRERVVELVPGRRLGYTLESGLPLRGYRANVDLTPDGSGTTIRWHSTFTARIPGTGWLYRRALGGFIRRTATGLAAYATTGPAS